jgi:hypothetical protein
MAEFDWWLLVLGLVVGGGLVYLVLSESARREADREAEELEAEATFISERLADQGIDVIQPDVAEVLREHRAYLRLPPPDAIVREPDAPWLEPEPPAPDRTELEPPRREPIRPEPEPRSQPEPQARP